MLSLTGIRFPTERAEEAVDDARLGQKESSEKAAEEQRKLHTTPLFPFPRTY